MKKDNNLSKFTSFVLLVTTIALILVAGTFAKYTSEVTGTATATVAKWEILAGATGEEVDISGSDQTIAFNLFDTILEEDGVTEELDVLMDEETGKVIRIAPGTSGAFDLSVVNNSEVTAAYTIGFVVEDTSVDYDIPLEFNVNDNGWTTSLEDVQETIIAIGDSSEAKVQWKWAFEGGVDSTDTMLGIEAPSITVTATLNVVQYDASEAPVAEGPVEDLEAYAVLEVSSDAANQYIPEEAVGIPMIVSSSKNLYLEAGTTITAKSENYGFYVITQDSENITQLTANKMGSVSGMEGVANGGSKTVEEGGSGWYGIAIRNSDNSSFDETNLLTLGDYVTFSK